MDERFREDFWALLCSFSQSLRVLFILVTILLLLTVAALLGGDPNSAGYRVALLDLAVLLPLWAVVGQILRKC